ncbi:nucleoside triphosphate pyrophosphatase [Nocardioides sp. AE5]|uniref:Maf family protein n=1 Tax=Nocardioides sp. AE5 TaxID=2962573 RepID=UPI0028811A9A|nr:nucleoside triphosphate pyrophosphatase [Nocardioides sp. AE5]MDT0201914.1 nucleoside triphosphate pyrophosphatase [Nocardioides sp. AE5]
MTTLILASASPARLTTLRRAGIEPEVIVSGVDEDGVGDLAPASLAQELAGLKAAAVAERVAGRDVLVLGCDSVLELDGEALGKPGTPEVAAARWRAMRGRSGVLHSGHALHHVPSGRVVAATGSTTIHFADVSDDEITAYVATGEPLQVAGAFTIDGFGGAFVRAIEGDHHNVIGVSLPLLRQLVLDLGLSWVGLWGG